LQCSCDRRLTIICVIDKEVKIFFMANLTNASKKFSQGRIIKKLPDNPTCLVTWTTKSGKKYYVILDKVKKIHNVYCSVEDGYQLLFATKDYYKIEKELEGIENGR